MSEETPKTDQENAFKPGEYDDLEYKKAKERVEASFKEKYLKTRNPTTLTPFKSYEAYDGEFIYAASILIRVFSKHESVKILGNQVDGIIIKTDTGEEINLQDQNKSISRVIVSLAQDGHLMCKQGEEYVLKQESFEVMREIYSNYINSLSPLR